MARSGTQGSLMRGAHPPPSIEYPFGPSRRVGWAMVGMAGWGLVGIGAWWLLGSSGLRPWVGLALWGICTALAWTLWRHQPCGQLAWDGREWSLRTEQVAASPVRPPIVHLDLQWGLLVSLQPVDGRLTWAWLERRRSPDRWSALRRAVYSRASSDNARTGATPSPMEGETYTKT